VTQSTGVITDFRTGFLGERETEAALPRPDPLEEDWSMYITRKTAVFLFVALAAVVTVGLTVGRDGLRHVDCNVGDPSYPCFTPGLGYSMGDLFISGPH
jgi:hypothetical protein